MPPTLKTAKKLSAKYHGQLFVFHSPFTLGGTCSWQDGDEGVLLRMYHYKSDPDILEEYSAHDLWEAYHLREGEVQFGSLLGGECFEPGTLRPLVREHAFAEETKMRNDLTLRAGRLQPPYGEILDPKTQSYCDIPAVFGKTTEPRRCEECDADTEMTWSEGDKSWYCDECFHPHVRAGALK